MNARPDPADPYVAILDDLQNAARAWAATAGHLTEDELLKALRTCESADSVGPILDPTAWKSASADGRLARQRRVLVASISFRAALLELWPDVGILCGQYKGTPVPPAEAPELCPPDPSTDPRARELLELWPGIDPAYSAEPCPPDPFTDQPASRDGSLHDEVVAHIPHLRDEAAMFLRAGRCAAAVRALERLALAA